MDLSGLGAVSGSFQEYQAKQAEIKLKAIQLTQAQNQLAAEAQQLQAQGAAFTSLAQGQVPQQGPGGMGNMGSMPQPPQQPPPGQVSQPMARPGMQPPGPPQGMPPQQGQPMPQGGAPMGGPAGAPQMQRPMAPPPQPPGGGMQQQQQGPLGATGAQQGGPIQILQGLAQQIKRANPNMDAPTMAMALAKTVEMMKGVEPDVRDQLTFLAKQNAEQAHQQLADQANQMKLMIAGMNINSREGIASANRSSREKLSAGEPLSVDDKASFGSQAATGEPLNQIASGYGKEAARVKMIARGEAIKQISEETGMDPKAAGTELARRQAMYQADKASVTQLDKMYGATKQAVGQLDFNLKQAKIDMAKLPSTDLTPVLNAIARGEEKWSGAPAYSQLFFHISAAANEAARLQSGGQASAAQLHEGAAEEARKWMNMNMTPASFDAVSDSIMGEGKARLETFQDAMKSQEPGRPDEPAPPPGSGSPPGGKVLRYDAQGNLIQ